MKGHIRKRGASWEWFADAGKAPALRCADCRHRVWVEPTPSQKSCPKCGGEMRATIERRQETRGGFAHKKTAEKSLGEFLHRAEHGGDPFPERTTLREYADRWLAAQATRVRPTTLLRYRGLLRDDALPVVGEVELARVRPGHVREVMDRMLARGLAPRSVVQARAVLSSLLGQAVEDGLIPFNAARSVRPPKPERPRLAVPDADQLAALIEGARGSRWEVPIVLAAGTGMRRSEVLAVQWDNVDLERSRLRVVRTLQRVPTGGRRPIGFLDPKTATSRREIALPSFVVATLRRHRREQNERRLFLGEGWQDLDLVCDDGVGGFANPDGFARAFKRIARAAGLPAATRLHDVRHGFATQLLDRGVHPAVASAMLGHSSPAFTMATYQHVDGAMTETAAKAIDDALGGSR